MPYLRNPFPIIKKYTNLRTYESQLNQAMKKFFKRKCVYIEKQVYKWENRLHPLHSIRDIFQLYNKNDRTPKFPREALKVLIHIRNSCS